MERLKQVLPPLLITVIFVAGVASIYHLLQEVDIHQVARLVHGTPLAIIAISLICMLGSYGAMVGYDWSALRYLGKPLPLRTVATGGFLGYAIGANVGAGPVTGGAVRTRIYTALGLSLADIATVAAFGSMSFAIGMTVIGTGALALYPNALDSVISMSPTVVRMLATVVFVSSVTLILLASIRQLSITVRGRTFQSPPIGLVGGQLLFTAIDFLLAATTLYLLLPPTNLGFIPFLSVFMAAVLAGVISHVPGGVGVFETVILAALPASVPVEAAAAGLLLYRVIYYFVPFALALIILAGIELRKLPTKTLPTKTLAPLARVATSILPVALSAMTFAVGVYMLLAPLIPSTSPLAQDLDAALPLSVLEGGALLSSIIGTALVIIAHGLSRRLQGAWWLTLGLFIAGIIASLAHGLDYERTCVMALAALVLLPTRKSFFRTTRLTRNLLGVQWLLTLTALIALVVAVLFFANKATPYAHDLWWQFAVDQAAPRALRAALAAVLTLGTLLLSFSLRPGSMSHALPSKDDMIRAKRIIAAQDDPDANIALTGDKHLMFSKSGNAFLMYRVEGRTWVALHEPYGDPNDFPELAWMFHDLAHAANGRPVFYSASAKSVPLWLDLGLSLTKMGEIAIVDLAHFSLEGKKGKRLRTTHNRALRDGLTFDLIPAPIPDATLATLERISDAWLATKTGGEKGFSVGVFDRQRLAQFPVATVSYNGEIVAFANIWTTDGKARATIDLMRHVDDAPSGLMEFLFTELLLHFKSDGTAEFSLGNAPLSGLEGRRHSQLLTRLGAFIYRHGRHFYNFEGLRMFKEKFSPRWEPIFLATPRRANLVVITKDIASLIGGGLATVVKKVK